MAKSPIDKDLIRDLADLLTETDLNEIEIEKDGMRLRVARGVSSAQIAAQPAPAAAPASASPASDTPGSNSPANAVTSPMVGTVYVAPEPGAPPYVRAGDQVAEGDTLLVVEAMKVMNPIPAPRAGRVARIFISNGEPVEFGEPLLVLE